MDNMASISMDSLLRSLSLLSTDNRRWLAEHLMEQVEEEEKSEKQKDKEFMSQLFATPFHTPLSAEDEIKEIRNSRHFSPDRSINCMTYGSK